MVNEKANVHVTLNSKEAQHQLEELQGEMKRLIELKRKAEEAGDVEGYKKIDKEIKKVSRSANKLVREHQDLEQTINNLSTAPIKDLEAAKRSLRAQVKKLNRDTDEYTRKRAQLDLVENEIRQINRQYLKQHGILKTLTHRVGNFASKIANGFNKYFAVVTTMVASLTGITIGFRKAADEANAFEESLDNLSALTGLEGEQLEWLGDMAKQTSIEITESGVRIKQSATDIVNAYTKVGSQRPELLKNKEALHEVTKNAIILSEAAKSELEPAVAGLTMAMNQHNLAGNESSRVINAMAAGSKEGAGDIPYLTKAIEKSGTTLNLMNVSLEENIGLIEAVAPNYSRAEMAGNSLDKVFLKMKANQIGYKNGVFSVDEALKELETRFNNGETAVQLFGVEHAKMAELLVQNRAEVNRYTEAVTGTNIAIEQAVKNTDNNAARMAQARNELKLSAIELGERLNPALTKGLRLVNYFVKALARLVTQSPVKELQQNRIEVNRLVMSITSLNEGEETRIKLIEELKQKYPQYYGEIDAATVSNNALLQSLREVNRQMVRQIYIAGRKEELAELQENASKKLAIEVDYQERLDNLKTQYFLKMGVEQQEVFTADFDFMMRHYEKITSMYSTSAEKAIAVTRWLQKNKLSKQFEGGLDYGDMTALSISYNEWLEAYRKRYKAEAEAEKEAKKIKDYEDLWGIGKEGVVSNPISDNNSTSNYELSQNNAFTEDDEGIDAAKDLAEKKANEEEWTQFLLGEIEKRANAEAQALQIEKEVADARIEINNAIISSAGQVAGALAGMAEQGSFIQIAFIAIEKAAGIAKIWINYAKEVSAIRLAAAEINAVTFGIGGNIWGAAQLTKARTSAIANTAVIAAQTVASTVSSGKRKKTEAYAEGKYQPITQLQTGTYGNQPHLAIFNEVPGEPEMVIDGKTNRNLHMNYPEIIRAIYAVRDGRQPQFYADGKYNETAPADTTPTQPYTPDPEIKELIRQNREIMEILMDWEIPITAVEKELNKRKRREKTKGM